MSNAMVFEVKRFAEKYHQFKTFKNVPVITRIRFTASDVADLLHRYNHFKYNGVIYIQRGRFVFRLSKRVAVRIQIFLRESGINHEVLAPARKTRLPKQPKQFI